MNAIERAGNNQPQPLMRGGIIGLQSQFRQVGRIRYGERDAEKGFPKRLSCPRLTTPDRQALENAAKVYGGQVKPWRDHPGEFELYTEKPELDIYVAPMPMSQYMEMWTKGGCQRRCDGASCALPDGSVTGCMCPFSDRKAMEAGQKAKVPTACKMVMRIPVILYKVPGIGVWRVDTSSYYASTEIPATAMELQKLAYRGVYVPARLAAPIRTRVHAGQTKNFPVIEIRVDLSMEMVAGALSLPERERLQSLDSANEFPDAPMTDEHGEVLADPKKAEGILRTRGWLTQEHKGTLAKFKEHCKEEGFDWMRVLIDADGNNCASWEDVFAHAKEMADVPAEAVEAEVVEDNKTDGRTMAMIASDFSVEGNALEMFLGLQGVPEEAEVRAVLDVIAKTQSVNGYLYGRKAKTWGEFAPVPEGLGV